MVETEVACHWVISYIYIGITQVDISKHVWPFPPERKVEQGNQRLLRENSTLRRYPPSPFYARQQPVSTSQCNACWAPGRPSVWNHADIRCYRRLQVPKPIRGNLRPVTATGARPECFCCLKRIPTGGYNTYRFPSGPVILMRQATAYAIRHRTRFGALFNHDWLICCHGPWPDTSKGQTVMTAKNLASRSELSVEVDTLMYSHASPDRQLMRLALLGFMWSAAEDI
jgi:hypothetical protein